MRLSSRVRLTAIALVAAASLAACSGGSPLTALKPYAASDGLQASVGDIRGLNLLVLTRGAGEPAVLTGTLDNTGESDATVTVTVSATAFSVAIPAGESVALGLGEDETPVVVATSPAAPGLIATVTLATGGDATDSPVPVLDDTLPEYAATLVALDTLDPAP